MSRIEPNQTESNQSNHPIVFLVSSRISVPLLRVQMTVQLFLYSYILYRCISQYPSGFPLTYPCSSRLPYCLLLLRRIFVVFLVTQFPRCFGFSAILDSGIVRLYFQRFVDVLVLIVVSDTPNVSWSVKLPVVISCSRCSHTPTICTLFLVLWDK